MRRINLFYFILGFVGMLAIVLCAVLMREQVVNIWVGALLYGIGAGLFGSASMRMFRTTKISDPDVVEKERAEEKSERNKLITMKVRSRLYSVMQLFEGIVFLLLCSQLEMKSLYCYGVMGLILVQGLAEIAMRGYYESRS